MLKKWIPLFAALFPMVADATGGASGTQQITQINTDSYNGFIEIFCVSAWGNPDGCSNASTVVVPLSNPNYRDMLASALMASATGKNVQFWVVGCASTPWGTEPIAVTIMTY